MNLDEFRVEESPTDLDGARNVCVTLDHVGDHNEIPILNVSTDDVSGNTLEHFYEYLWVNSGYVASRSKDVVTIDCTGQRNCRKAPMPQKDGFSESLLGI